MMKNNNQKENWLEEFRKWYKKEALPAVAWAVPLEKIEGKIQELLKSEKEKSYKDGLERAYEIICGYPEANVMQPRLDIKEEIKRT